MRITSKRQRWTAGFLALCMTLSILGGILAFAAPASLNRNSWMHFIIRHWHSKKVDGLQYQGGELEMGNDRYFVVAEGYIAPAQGGGYEFYAVDRESGELDEITDEFAKSSGYISALDRKNGSITLLANPATDKNGNLVEMFSGFSISAGRGAVTYVDDDDDDIMITYDPYIHLVKGHVFYVRAAEAVPGTNDTVVFPAESGEQLNKEVDTAYAFVYTEDWEGHLKGEIVKYTDNGTEYVCTELSQLPPGAEEHVEWHKVYSTHEGLHTDKTAYETDDERVFELELEAWYNEGYPSQVGMVLDSSGSMAFTSEELKRVSVDNDGTVAASKYGAVNQVSNEIERGYGSHIKDAPTYPKEEKLIAYYSFDNGSLANGVKGGDAASLVSQLTTGGTHNESINGNQPLSFGSGPRVGANLDNIVNDKGFHIGQAGAGYAEYALKVASIDTISSFTVSFTVTVGTGGSSDFDIAELLYVGPSYIASGDSEWNNIFRAVRNPSGSVPGRLTAGYGRDTISKGGNRVSYDNSAFSGTSNITMVFKHQGNRVYNLQMYKNGALCENTTATFTLNERDIYFNPFIDQYSGPGIYIDDIYVYNSDLSEDQVASLNKMVGTKIDGKIIDWDKIILSDAEVNSILDTHLTDNSRLGVSSYTYYVYNPSGDVLEYAPLGYWDGSTNGRDPGDDSPIATTADKQHIIGNVRNGSTSPGWYYVTHGSWSNYTNPELYTAKQLMSLPVTHSVPDLVYAPGENADTATGSGTGHSYYIERSSPIRFYVDDEGYLRCFFCMSDDTGLFASYVYMLEDSGYVKTESLQRALGSFVTNLSEKSPGSAVSAVRFSDGKATPGELVMLDWTTNAGESSAIMSLTRGDGSAAGSEPSTRNKDASGNAILQYNYGLTGNTSTRTGIQAFREYLEINDFLNDSDPYNDNGKKYLIIFTDGKDTDRNNDYKDEAKDLVDDLKDNGYIIFTVMLAGGPVVPGSDDYEIAKEFLVSLSSLDEDGNPHFYSTAEQTADSGKAADALTSIFSEKILDEIVGDLQGYTVTDYIDPRFDMVDASGRVWHLNSGGSVVIGDGSAEGSIFTVGTAHEHRIAITDNTDLMNGWPYLCYDQGNDMYYLDWVGQTIPTSSVGATTLMVWRSIITVKAKDDFIGGNEVLTNGQASGMNWVYYPNDNVKSSATGDMFRKTGSVGMHKNSDSYPSKGFPRTTVNVGKGPGMEGLSQIIYLGESIDPAKLAKELLSYNKENVEAIYYWVEYLERYADWQGQTAYNGLDALLRAVVNSRGGFELPYYYLPNVPTADIPANQPGLFNAQQSDELGVIRYVWELVDPVSEEPIEEGGYGAGLGPKRGEEFITLDTRDVKYKLTVTYWPYPDPDTPVSSLDIYSDPDHREYVEWCERNPARRTSENFDLITETAYGPQSTQASFPKKAVGLAQHDATVSGTYNTRIVRGELAIEMTLMEENLAYLFSEKNTLTYTVNVTREYPEGTAALSPELPDLTITVDKAELKGMRPGDILYHDEANQKYPKVVCNRNGSFTFYSDPRIFDPESGMATLLPIGTYTLTPDEEANKEKWVDVLAALIYSPREHYERNGGHFTDNADAANSKDSVYHPSIKDDENSPYYDLDHPDDPNYFAYESGIDGVVSFELGTHDLSGDPGKRSYLEDRVGMATVKFNWPIELPETGGTNRYFSFVGCALLVGAALLLVIILERNNGRHEAR
ncbi:MAG: VWA domain-containing protein [Oscillospiraceae bacterium]|nr:VWA domain-containing protein [Oscillospiraceae bacterium]